MKTNLKFENYENSSEQTKLENKINHLEKKKIYIDNLKKNYKQFIRNNKRKLKLQQRFKSKSHNAFTKEINKIALSSNDDKRLQSIDSIETYAYRNSKSLVSEKKRD